MAALVFLGLQMPQAFMENGNLTECIIKTIWSLKGSNEVILPMGAKPLVLAWGLEDCETREEKKWQNRSEIVKGLGSKGFTWHCSSRSFFVDEAMTKRWKPIACGKECMEDDDSSFGMTCLPVQFNFYHLFLSTITSHFCTNTYYSAVYQKLYIKQSIGKKNST